jgi:hypothetical protein
MRKCIDRASVREASHPNAPRACPRISFVQSDLPLRPSTTHRAHLLTGNAANDDNKEPLCSNRCTDPAIRNRQGNASRRPLIPSIHTSSPHRARHLHKMAAMALVLSVPASSSCFASPHHAASIDQPLPSPKPRTRSRLLRLSVARRTPCYGCRPRHKAASHQEGLA